MIALYEAMRIPAESLLTDTLLLCMGCNLCKGCTKGLKLALRQHNHTVKPLCDLSLHLHICTCMHLVFCSVLFLLSSG